MYVFKVNGVTIKSPARFKIEFQPITEANRLLSGNMSIKGVAGKRKLILSYNSIKESDLQKILGVTWDEFLSSKVIKQTVTFHYIGGSSKTINTYFSPTSIELTPDSARLGRWENFEMAFIEI